MLRAGWAITMNNITMVARWRCHCGVHIKVLAETDRDNPVVATRSAACPECGNQRIIYAERIMSIEMDSKDDTARRGNPTQSHVSPP
jgi:hypothetical protein